jgi:hypothetical protein
MLTISAGPEYAINLLRNPAKCDILESEDIPVMIPRC